MSRVIGIEPVAVGALVLILGATTDHDRLGEACVVALVA